MKNLEEIFKRYPVVSAYLFGSRSRNQGDVDSDYDFGIVLQEKIHAPEMLNIRLNLLKELTRSLKKPVDIIIMNSKNIPLSLKFRIIKEGKIVYIKDDLARSRFETKILSLYLDRKYYYNRHIDVVLKNIAQRGLVV
ncbi:MAG: nucleotidyltransferase domain-containing protein [candidate division WOR-3 bacterium]